MATISQLQRTLQVTYGIVPMVAGIDKFTNLLTDWKKYLGIAGNIIPLAPETFMHIVGVIEIAAGLLVLIRPLTGAYVVMAWLICIALQLMASGQYFDVAVRDLVISVGAYTLAQLTKINRTNNG